MPDLHYGFVVDRDGPFGYQAYLLSRSLIGLAGVDPSKITASLVEGTHPSAAATLARLGVNVAWVESFGHPYCNKIQQLPNLLDVDTPRVVLLDADTFVLAKPDFPDGERVLGKMVDGPNPPMPILSELFADAGLPWREASSDVIPGPTRQGNFNGGLYVLPTARLPEIHMSWASWARWCLARVEVFAQWSVHIDQVAFAMAMADIGLAVEALPRRYNTPTHLGSIAAAGPPLMLHYHRHVDTQLLLLPTGDPTVDAAIESANEAILGWRADELPNDLFWTARYALHPELGSGIGSRGPVLERKRRMLSRMIRLFRPESIVDIGGGDGQAIEGLATGIHHAATDIAPGSMVAYRDRNPGADFTVADITTAPAPKPADLAVCLDLLIHIPDRDAYRTAVRHIVDSGRIVSVVSGFDDRPVASSSLVYFHEPLLATIEEDKDVTAFPVMADRGLVAYAVVAGTTGIHPRDATTATLRTAIRVTPDPAGLLESVVVSRRELGFFPDHLPRCIEYPWILERIRAMNRPGLRIVDVGAGVNVLPLLLHDDGHDLTTIDAHPVTRTLDDRAAWNEWGFFDYGALRPGIRSLRQGYEYGEGPAVFDVIYSVSVIEHLSAATRRTWLARMRQEVAAGGRCLLTVDLEPISRDLWRFSEGVEVEPSEQHGTVDDLLDELTAAGFAIVSSRLVEWLPTTRVGLAMIEAHPG